MNKAARVALALKAVARLEDLHVWQMEKVKFTKNGSRYYFDRMATRHKGGNREISTLLAPENGC